MGLNAPDELNLLLRTHIVLAEGTASVVDLQQDSPARWSGSDNHAA
jgi:hypothetical protein